MQEIGEVASVEGGQVVVRFQRQAACQGCRACGYANGKMQISLADPGGLAPGDWVTMELAPKYYYRSAALLYGLPLGMLLVGAGIGAAAFGQAGQAWAALLGLGMAAGTYVVLHLLEPRFRKQSQFQIRLVKVNRED